MRLFILLAFLNFNPAWAEIGKVIKLVGDNDAYVVRANNKVTLSPDTKLELQDEIHSINTYVVIHLYPGTQMSLAKNTQVKLTESMIEDVNDLQRSSSIIDFIKGIIRVQVTKEANEEIDQKIQTEGVSFAVRGTEFEISLEENKDVDLDVFEGQVEVSSPYVQSFVPEYVKANEGFRFDRKKKNFSKRRFAPKFRNHPGFENPKKLKARWKTLKKDRKAKKAKRKGSRK